MLGRYDPKSPSEMIAFARVQVPPDNTDPSVRELLIRDLANALEESAAERERNDCKVCG